MTTAAELINKVAEGFQAKLDSLNSAAAAATGAANNVVGIIQSFHSPFQQRVIYVDVINGKDINSGLTAALPVKTWERMLDLIYTSRRNVVRLMSDINADYYRAFRSAVYTLEFEGVGEDGLTKERRKVTFTSATNHDYHPGGLHSYGAMTLVSDEVDFEMAYSNVSEPIQCYAGTLQVFPRRGVITRTGTGAALFGAKGSAHYEAVGIVIDASASGHVIEGVPAGDDPDRFRGISSNFNEA